MVTSGWTWYMKSISFRFFVFPLIPISVSSLTVYRYRFCIIISFIFFYNIYFEIYDVHRRKQDHCDIKDIVLMLLIVGSCPWVYLLPTSKCTWVCQSIRAVLYLKGERKTNSHGGIRKFRLIIKNEGRQVFVNYVTIAIWFKATTVVFSAGIKNIGGCNPLKSIHGGLESIHVEACVRFSRKREMSLILVP